MKKLLALIALSLITAVVPAFAADSAPTIYIIGDSTAANKSKPAHPERGWGQLFGEFVIAPAGVDNRALNGRSTKTFITQKHWDKVASDMRAGDWLIIQFGHNDQKENKPDTYAAARGEYRDNLLRFVRIAREKGAHPILATSVVRRRWDADGKSLVETLGEYPAVVRELAVAEKIPLLDMNKLTAKMEQDAGVEGSKKFHLWFEPGAHPEIPKGIKDDTHYSEIGARTVASLAAAEIKRLALPLAAWITQEPQPPAKTIRQN